MKKLLLALVMICGMAVGASAAKTYSHDASVLPANAARTLKENFKAQVSLVKVDKDFGRISEYEVILTDGTEITFKKDGTWENVETRKSGQVPSAFIPKNVAEYLKQNHRGARVVGIEKERSGYDVELSNGIDIKFNKQGMFERYDD